jgi:HD superfamily phosphohydrolase
VNVYDPLYGRFELSTLSSELCVLPEVRRLSQIRLLNSMSPSLATLAELRRYAHTLGVLHLFGVWRSTNGRKYSQEELNALEVAIILHDVATPPFGHLFEYILKEATGWDHESAAVTTLLKEYSPASTAQKIYAGKSPKVLDWIERRHVNLEIVKEILTKRHKLSGLIMGVVDFDNLDNVWRMAWALGFKVDTDVPRALAEAIDVDDHGNLLLASGAEALLPLWASLRRAVYDVLVFDQPTVASQTILTHCIRLGLAQGDISSEDWFLHDESLLAKLSSNPELKTLVEQQYLGKLPEPLLTLQVRWKDLPFYKLPRADIERMILESLQQAGKEQYWVYVFKERGSFEKRVRYSTQEGEASTVGSLSESLVVSVFSGKMLTSFQRRVAASAVVGLLQHQGVGLSDFLRCIEAGDESSTLNSKLPL